MTVRPEAVEGHLTRCEDEQMDFAAGKLIHRLRSKLNRIEISESDGMRLLRTDQRAVQSTLNIARPEQLVLPYMAAMMTGLLFQPDPARTLLLGLGGGDLVRFLLHYLPRATIDAVEIDPLMAMVSREHFALPDSERLTLHIDDAGHFISQRHDDYSLILVDIYAGDGVPKLLLEPGFYRNCRDKLAQQGLLVINVLTNDAATFLSMMQMIRSRFNRATLCLSVPHHTNVIIFAFEQRPAPLTLSPLLEQAAQLSERFELELGDWTRQLFTTNPTMDGALLF